MLTQVHALAIVRKLSASVSRGRGGHDLAVFRYDGKYIGQFGIRRASREVGHDYIPKQLFLTAKQCRELAECPLSLEGYVGILREKGVLPAANTKS